VPSVHSAQSVALFPCLLERFGRLVSQTAVRTLLIVRSSPDADQYLGVEQAKKPVPIKDRDRTAIEKKNL
jgi:hypothetical protein